MPQPGRSARGLDAGWISPLLFGTVLAALVSTGVVIAVWHVDATTPAAQPSTHRADLAVAVGLAAVAWVSVVFVYCRDIILRRMDEFGDQLAAQHAELTQALQAAENRLVEHFSRTASDLAEQAEESGVFRGMELETRRLKPPARPEGGQVIRHPRLAEAPDRPS